MATKAKTRRPPVASIRKSTVKGKAPTVSTEEISRELASVTNSKAKSTRNGVTPIPMSERKVLAMRTANGASQGLSTVMKTGWKAPSDDPTVKKPAASTHEAFGLATSARTALEDLRAISPGDVDVERAAIAVVGKLLSLDMVRADSLSGRVLDLFLKVRTRIGRAFGYAWPTCRARELRYCGTS